jgi:hypothetical protein
MGARPENRSGWSHADKAGSQVIRYGLQGALHCEDVQGGW